jgi:hypothetical protein
MPAPHVSVRPRAGAVSHLLLVLLAACDAGVDDGGGVRVEVSGQPTQQRSGAVTCRYGDGGWVASFAEPGVLEVNAVLDAMAADTGTTPDAYLTLVRDGTGPGRATLLLSPDQGSTAPRGTLRTGRGGTEIRVEGLTADGRAVDARFRCTEVHR